METERIKLRPWLESDAEVLFKYASDPEVGPRAGWVPHRSVEESLQVIRTFFKGDHTWAIELRATGEPIGCIGYLTQGESNISIGQHDAEVGCWIARPYWNQGIASEALRLVMDYCFGQKGIQTLWADHFLNNPASGQVLEKCGFRPTGETTYCRHLFRGESCPVRVLRADAPN